MHSNNFFRRRAIYYNLIQHAIFSLFELIYFYFIFISLLCSELENTIGNKNFPYDKMLLGGTPCFL
jgi:uncharacterized membrane protein